MLGQSCMPYCIWEGLKCSHSAEHGTCHDPPVVGSIVMQALSRAFRALASSLPHVAHNTLLACFSDVPARSQSRLPTMSAWHMLDSHSHPR